MPPVLHTHLLVLAEFGGAEEIIAKVQRGRDILHQIRSQTDH
jgi:hypothetical protein